MTVSSSFWKPATAATTKEILVDPHDAATNITFPLALEPREAAATVADLLGGAAELAPQHGDSLHANRIRHLLDDSGGAVHLKSLPLRSVDDFSRFLTALAGEGEAAWRPYEALAMNVLRRKKAENVFTVNEGPPSQVISWHSEFSISPSHPGYVVFFCLSPPGAGGTTGISQSQAVLARLRAACPRFVRTCVTQGLAYPAPHYAGESRAAFFGNGLYKKTAYGPADGADLAGRPEAEKRHVVEDRIRALARFGGWADDIPPERTKQMPVWQRRGFSWQWRDDGVDVFQRVPGVRIHPTCGTETLFTALGSRHVQAKQRKTHVPPHTYINENGEEVIYMPPTYAGEPVDQLIPEEDLDVVQELQNNLSVDIEWEIGDVLIIDNFAVQHSRMPWTGDRKIMASFWEQKNLSAVPVTVVDETMLSS